MPSDAPSIAGSIWLKRQHRLPIGVPADLFDKKGPGWRGDQEVGFRTRKIKPLHVLVARDHCALTLLISRDLGVGRHRQHSESLRMVLRPRPPDTGKVEPVSVLAIETVAPPSGPDVEFARRDEAAMGGKRSIFRTDEPKGRLPSLRRRQAPDEFDQLGLAIRWITPDDGATRTIRSIRLEGLGLHG